MTGVEEPPASPHGKVFYCLVAVPNLLFGCGATFAVFAAGDAGFAMRLLAAAIAIVLLFAAFQSLERVFRPQNARRRSAALSDPARRKLRATSIMVAQAGAAAFVAGGAIQLITRMTDGHRSDLATDIGQLAAVLIVLAYSLADLCGVRLPSRAWGQPWPN